MYLKIENYIYKIKIAKTMKQKIIGLIGKKNINYGLLIPKCNSVHTFFMRESIDILALDNNNKIIYKNMNVCPNATIKVFNEQKNTSILELPSYASKSLKINDKLIFESKNII